MDALRKRLKETFAWVGDAGTSSTLADRSGWARDGDVIAAIGKALAGLYADDVPTLILAPQSSGYLYGGLVAQAVGVGFVGASKERRDLAASDKWLVATTPLDYAGRNMELSFRASLMSGSDRVLVIDDWIDTGGQLLALKSLVEKSGARYIGAAVIVDGLIDHNVRRNLGLRSLLNVRDL
jgi:adenine phosphoribosyltransferase